MVCIRLANSQSYEQVAISVAILKNALLAVVLARRAGNSPRFVAVAVSYSDSRANASLAWRTAISQFIYLMGHAFHGRVGERIFLLVIKISGVGMTQPVDWGIPLSDKLRYMLQRPLCLFHGAAISCDIVG
jgi:hypothetical protein